MLNMTQAQLAEASGVAEIDGQACGAWGCRYAQRNPRKIASGIRAGWRAVHPRWLTEPSGRPWLASEMIAENYSPT